jgi:tripartite-type tricarboxylate transporter receptor subunit TctC
LLLAKWNGMFLLPRIFSRLSCRLALLGLTLLSGWVHAQFWPVRPVRLVVPFPAGGGTDILSRELSKEVGRVLGQLMVVDNKPGAGGSIGVNSVAKAAADGYTLLLTTSSTHSISPAINPHLSYDAEADFTPIVTVATSPQILLVSNGSAAHNLKEFLDEARRRPGQMNYASAGNGTISHLSTEILKVRSGTSMVHVPYRGTGLSLADLMTGKVHLLLDSFISGWPHVKEGQVRALAVTSLHRSTLAPELPTVSELYPGYESVTWFGLYGPKGLPASVVGKLNETVNAVLTRDTFRARLAQLGAEPAGGTPEQFAAMVRADRAKWHQLVSEHPIDLK